MEAYGNINVVMTQMRKPMDYKTLTFNVAKYDIVRTDSGDKRSFLETPDILEDEMTVESYETGINQQYQAIETALQNVANLVAQKEKLEAWLVDNPIVEPEEEPVVEE